MHQIPGHFGRIYVAEPALAPTPRHSEERCRGVKRSPDLRSNDVKRTGNRTSAWDLGPGMWHAGQSQSLLPPFSSCVVAVSRR